MAITNEQRQLLDAMFDGSEEMQELFTANGMEGTFNLLREWAAERGVTEASAALASAGSVSVSSWATVDAVKTAGVQAAGLIGLLTAILTKLDNHDADGLFALLIAHALANKNLRGM